MGGGVGFNFLFVCVIILQVAQKKPVIFKDLLNPRKGGEVQTPTCSEAYVTAPLLV